MFSKKTNRKSLEDSRKPCCISGSQVLGVEGVFLDLRSFQSSATEWPSDSAFCAKIVGSSPHALSQATSR